LALRIAVIVWPTGTMVALDAGLVAVTISEVLKLKLYAAFGLPSLSRTASAGTVTI
jgi:hypothetical protein